MANSAPGPASTTSESLTSTSKHVSSVSVAPPTTQVSTADPATDILNAEVESPVINQASPAVSVAPKPPEVSVAATSKPPEVSATPKPPEVSVAPTPTPEVSSTPTPKPEVSVTPAPTPPAATPPLVLPVVSSSAPSVATSSTKTQQALIDLTVENEPKATQPYTDMSSKSFMSSQFPQLGSKRSPSPSLLQPGRGRSPSPASFMAKPSNQSYSQVLSGQSLPPGIAFLHHSHGNNSDVNTQHDTAPPPAKKKRLFHRELMSMMRGFGDDPNPHSETVDLIEELVIKFITEMTQKAMDVGKSGRVQVNDIIFMIRKDHKKYARVKDLLTMKEQIDKAKKAFTEDAETSDDMS